MKWTGPELKYIEDNEDLIESYGSSTPYSFFRESPSYRIPLLIHYLKYGGSGIVFYYNDSRSPVSGGGWYFTLAAEFPGEVRAPITDFRIAESKIEDYKLLDWILESFRDYGGIDGAIVTDIVKNCKIDDGFKGRLTRNGKPIHF